MGPCVICGERAMSIDSIIFENGKAFLLVLRDKYCAVCAAKRIEELTKTVKERKNILSIISNLEYFEELKEIE